MEAAYSCFLHTTQVEAQGIGRAMQGCRGQQGHLPGTAVPPLVLRVELYPHRNHSDRVVEELG